MNFNQCKHRLGGSNSGFTLVELLFVIAIISVLSTLSLGIMLSAQDDAKESATLSRIRQVEAILQIELEEYEVRRLPIRTRDLIPGGAGVGVRVRNLRRRIIADIINAELPTLLVNQNGTPDPNDDSFVIPELGVFPTNQPSVMQPGDGIERMGFRDWLDDNFPGLASDLEGVASSRVTAWSSVIAMQDIPNGKIFDLPGEYLYEALRRINLDGDPAIETLGNQAVGDSDGDGFLEIIDAWGEPLQLIIWQIAAQEVDGSGNPMPGTDVWEDVPNAEFNTVINGGPTGYTLIDPTVPREVSKIRFEVRSTRLAF